MKFRGWIDRGADRWLLIDETNRHLPGTFSPTITILDSYFSLFPTYPRVKLLSLEIVNEKNAFIDVEVKYSLLLSDGFNF